MFESVEKLKQVMDDAKKAMKDQGQSAIKQSFAELFAAYPKLQAVRWQQYTPYFNDGEECVFGVHDFHAKIDGLKDAESGYEEFVNTWDITKEQKAEHHLVMESIKQLETLLPEEMLKSVFDDHVQVTATREGFQVDSHSHD